MAKLEPFKGIRYNPAVAGDVGLVLAPPYDVISPREQELYYTRSPFNIIRLEYGITRPGDNDGSNRYTRAASTLAKWLAEGVLQAELERAFYLHRHTFRHDGKEYCRTGLIAALKLESYESGSVLPHEETHPGPKADRLELLRRCRANFSPIFGLFPDPERKVEEIATPVLEEEPLLELAGEEGESHRLWKLADPGKQQALSGLLVPLPLFIADGHHRYETALHYARESGAARDPGRGFILAEMVALQDPGLLVLPTHRLLKNPDGRGAAALPGLLEAVFHLQDRGDLAGLALERFLAGLEQAARQRPALGLFLPRKAGVLTLKKTPAGKVLDVEILQEKILRPLLEDTPAGETEILIDYTRDAAEARRAVLSGEAAAAFILVPAPLAAITARAARGEKMPHKSTYFYPKPPGGLAIYHHALSL